jgi:hypothetical protein
MKITTDFQPSPAEAAYVANHLRERQKDTIRQLEKSPGWMSLTNAALSRFVAVIKADGEPISLLGVADFPEPSTGLVWAMSTDEVEKYPVAFTKAVKALIENHCFFYDHLVSFVNCQDVNYQAFNDTIGFILSGEVYTNQETGDKFYRFDFTTNKGLTNMYSRGEKNDN